MRATTEMRYDSRTFNVRRFRPAIEEYRRFWALTDQELLRLCREHPHHHERDAVNAKLLIIGRAYATGIERQVVSDRKQGSALATIAKHFVKHADRLDGIIDSLPAGRDRWTRADLEFVVEAHGRFVTLLCKITREEREAHSFASKYLHFHRPIVPLYDRFAAQMLPKLVRWNRSLQIVEWRRSFDETYYTFVMRLWRLFEQLREAGEEPTVKELDYYLLWEAEHPWTE